jgi:hypothetical protein
MVVEGRKFAVSHTFTRQSSVILLTFPAGPVLLRCYNTAKRQAVRMTNIRSLEEKHDFIPHTYVTHVKFKNRPISIEAIGHTSI